MKLQVLKCKKQQMQQQQMINTQQQQQQLIINPQQQQMSINQVNIQSGEPQKDLRNLLATGNQQQKVVMPQQGKGNELIFYV